MNLDIDDSFDEVESGELQPTFCVSWSEQEPYYMLIRAGEWLEEQQLNDLR